ncbi:hypothetical protein HY572_06175 [Candidatus Micrarchaeota archaeon]|nr:hypothetical protein [Candidatus Micrarchaeota archaeon]
MDHMLALTALLALVLVAAAFQSVELADLESSLEKIKPAAAPSAQPLVAAAPAQSGGLNGLPNMVGGC